MNIRVLDIQNVSLFIIACYSFYCHANYYFCVNDLHDRGLQELGGGECAKPFHTLAPFLWAHAVVDLAFTRSIDVILHHFCIIGNAFYALYYGVSSEHQFIFLYAGLKMEISSIFYILKYWLPQNTVAYNVNLMVFYVLFFKFRIYDYYYELLYNHIQFDILFQHYPQSTYLMSSIVIASCYGLYFLNMYWFCIMTKTLYKMVAKMFDVDKDILCHFLTSYLLFANIPLAFIMYQYNPDDKYIFDMIGITCLGVASYGYHNNVYTRLSENANESYIIPTKENIVLFINDNLAINLRSFLAIATKFYYSPHFYVVLFISGVIHLSSIYQTFLNILNLFIDYDTNKEQFLTIHNIITSAPLAFDILLAYTNSPIEIATPFLLVNVWIVYLYMVNPFYKLTHVAFHILLIAQTYYICLSNSK